MADWSLPTVDSEYTDFITEVKDRDVDVAKGLDPAIVTVTNPSTNMIRWNSASNKWQKYDGATWNDLTATYAISVSGTAGSVAWGNVTSTPTTLAGYGITDAQGLDADLTAVAGLSTTGLVVRTGAGTATTRSLTQPAAGLTIANSDGVSGSPTFALANDLLALESLASTGLARRTGTSTWSVGTAVATAEIANDAVTYAKIQNVSATDRLLGRSTSGAGDVEEITCTAAGRALLDDAANSNQRTTLGLGTIATQDASSVAITGGTIDDVAITDGTIIGVPITQNSQSTAYTLVLSDAGKHILHPTADDNARTFTIPANASVAYPTGTAITFVNQINTVTIAITSDTLTLAGAGTTGSRTLAANGMATALKIASTSWIISGTGLS